MTAADMTTISHERAREAAQRIINSAFGNDGRRKTTEPQRMSDPMTSTTPRAVDVVAAFLKRAGCTAH